MGEERRKGFEPEALWSAKHFVRWEKEVGRFFQFWGPLLVVSGVAGGLGAVFFRLLIILNEQFFFGLLGGNGVSVLFLPAIGGIIVGPIIYRWASEAWGHGVPEVMEALEMRGGRIRARVAAVKIIASSVTIGSGGSAGREGPIAQIGASVSSVVGQLLHLDERSLKLMVMAGASAGISGTFKAPIGGALFGLEVLNKRIRTADLVVMTLASIVGYAASVAILGPAPIFTTEGTSMKDIDIPFYLLLGLLGGLASYVWTRSLYGVEDAFARLRVDRRWFSPFLGGLVVGAIGLFFPATLGLGYGAMDQFFSGKLLPPSFSGSLLLFFFLLFLAKLGTSSFTIGSGGSGGIFSPSLFMGAMLGAMFGLVIDSLFPSVSPGYKSFALVGMAVIFAGAAKAPLMAAIIVGEMSQNFTLLPGLLIACVMSYLVSGPGSIYVFKVMRSEGRNIPDEYLGAPQLPAIARLAQSVMEDVRRQGKKKATEAEQDKTSGSEGKGREEGEPKEANRETGPPAAPGGGEAALAGHPPSSASREPKEERANQRLRKGTRTIEISSSPERIFRICSDPRMFSICLPRLENLKEVPPKSPRPGRSFEATWEIVGSRLDERFESTESRGPGALSIDISGTLRGSMHISLEQVGEGRTRVTLAYEYLLPDGLLQDTPAEKRDALIEREIDDDEELFLNNLKRISEL